MFGKRKGCGASCGGGFLRGITEPFRKKRVLEKTEGYEVITSDVLPGIYKVPRKTYRVVLHKEFSDAGLIEIFSEITGDCRDTEVVAWFYRDKQEIFTHLPFTVAMLGRVPNEPIKLNRR